jgi:RNA polymerase sigma factor (sigma-70 family)
LKFANSPVLKSDSADEQLMLAYKNGDAEAFEIVFERHRGWLLRTLRGRVRAAGFSSEDIAEDVAQETWLTIIRTSADYEATAKFTTWLFHIAQQRLVDQLRKLGVVEAHFSEPLNDESDGVWAIQAEGVTDISFDPANIVEHRALLSKFGVALACLPAQQSEVFMLVAEGGMSVPEVASSLGLALETVKSRLRYARARLASTLEEMRA